MGFQNLRKGTRLALLALAAIIGMIAIGVLSAYQIRDTLLQDRKVKTQHMVEVPYGVIARYAEKAKAAAMTDLELLRTAYFWINGMTPQMLMHRFAMAFLEKPTPADPMPSISLSRRSRPRNLFICGCWRDFSNQAPCA
jgi:hypothetical protein